MLVTFKEKQNECDESTPSCLVEEEGKKDAHSDQLRHITISTMLSILGDAMIYCGLSRNRRWLIIGFSSTESRNENSSYQIRRPYRRIVSKLRSGMLIKFISLGFLKKNPMSCIVVTEQSFNAVYAHQLFIATETSARLRLSLRSRSGADLNEAFVNLNQTKSMLEDIRNNFAHKNAVAPKPARAVCTTKLRAVSRRWKLPSSFPGRSTAGRRTNIQDIQLASILQQVLGIFWCDGIDLRILIFYDTDGPEVSAQWRI